MRATMTLVQASAALGKSYNATMRLVLTRVIRGEQRGGRWYCNADDVRRLSEQPEATSAPQAAS